MLKVSDVFIAGGEPTITYNPRTALQLESTIKDYLEDRYQLLSISGPTKFGKTVLVKKVIPSNTAFWVSGGQIDKIEDFWEHILEQAGGHTSFSEETSTLTSEGANNELRGSVAPGGVGVSSGHIEQTRADEGKKSTTTRVTSSGVTAVRRLVEDKLPLIIDDFHYIKQEVQLKIIRSLKQPVFEGLPLIVISVPHRAFDAVRVEKEMTGRVKPLPIPDWSLADLEAIARQGFEALNLFSEDETISRLNRKFRQSSPHAGILQTALPN